METTKNIEELLKKALSAELLQYPNPSFNNLALARKMVASRKEKVLASKDVFAHLAYFLNLKIKLYHAVIASIIIYAAVLFLDKEKLPINSEIISGEPSLSLAAVRNNTVLSSIQTFVLPN